MQLQCLQFYWELLLSACVYRQLRLKVVMCMHASSQLCACVYCMSCMCCYNERACRNTYVANFVFYCLQRVFILKSYHSINPLCLVLVVFCSVPNATLIHAVCAFHAYKELRWLCYIYRIAWNIRVLSICLLYSSIQQLMDNGQLVCNSVHACMVECFSKHLHFFTKIRIINIQVCIRLLSFLHAFTL